MTRTAVSQMLSVLMVAGVAIGPNKAHGQLRRPQTVSAGLQIGRHFVGAELEYRVVSRSAVVLRGEGLVLANERAVLTGLRTDIIGRNGAWLYATVLGGVHYCYTVALGGTGTTCRREDQYSTAGAVLGGAELQMGDGSAWSVAIETGRWLVDKPRYSQWVLSAVMRVQLTGK